MKKILYIMLFTMLSFFVLLPFKVNASTCEYPACCEYELQSGLQHNVSMTISFEGYNPAVTTFKYKSVDGTNVQVDIKNWNKKVEGTQKGKDYVNGINKCPEYVLFDEKNHFWGNTYEVYIGSKSDLQKIDASDKGDSLVPLKDEMTQEEKDKANNILKSRADEINSLKKEMEEKKCLNSETYNTESADYDYNLKSECYTMYQSLKNAVGSAKIDINIYQNQGLGDLGENPGLSGLYLEINSVETAISKIEEYYTAPSNKNPAGEESLGNVDIPTGDPMTCESLKNTDTYKIVKEVFKWIQIAAPIMLVIFGVIDFGKAVASGDNDALKKAQATFVKRVIVVAIIILLPLIMELLFSLLDGALGNNVSTCEINN